MLNHRAIATQGIGSGLGLRAIALHGIVLSDAGVYPVHIAAGASAAAGTVAVPLAPARRSRRRRRDEEELLALGLLTVH
ncbi:MAG: hypothetical protein L6Q68_02335 [Aquabacterium sp.]|nr:hypothetical protein [Aquabacterium sp.]